MQDNDKFKLLFNGMAEGVALHKYIYDKNGKIDNYIIEDVNKSFEKILNISKKDVINKLATEAYKTSEAPYLDKYINLKTGEERKFEIFFEPLQKYFNISVSQWGDDGFATIFFDITDNKLKEQILKEKNDNLEKINKLIIERELKMIELKDEIKKIKKD